MSALGPGGPRAAPGYGAVGGVRTPGGVVGVGAGLGVVGVVGVGFGVVVVPVGGFGSGASGSCGAGGPTSTIAFSGRYLQLNVRLLLSVLPRYTLRV